MIATFKSCKTERTCVNVPVMFSCLECMFKCSCWRLPIAFVRPAMVFCMFACEYINEFCVIFMLSGG